MSPASVAQLVGPVPSKSGCRPVLSNLGLEGKMALTKEDIFL
jgi:hypothetical protein